jgi:hypothetical protein
MTIYERFVDNFMFEDSLKTPRNGQKRSWNIRANDKERWSVGKVHA